MMKRLVSAVALSIFVAGAALAQAPAETEAAAPAPSTEAPAATTGNTAPAPAETGSITQTESGTRAPASEQTNAPTPGTGAETAAVPDSVDSCIAAAAELGSSAESKTLSSDNADHLDVLFSKMETLCDGEKFTEAVGVANDIRSIINAN